MTDVRKLAIEYWQDDLAKFTPTLKEPHGSCLVMYEAGFKKGLEMAAGIADRMAQETGKQPYVTAWKFVAAEIRAFLEKSE